MLFHCKVAGFGCVLSFGVSRWDVWGEERMGK